jgi:small subunit ribosomal protein S20
MATHKSAEKAARQAIKHAERNRSAISAYRTTVKKLRTAIAANKGKKDEGRKTLDVLFSQTQRVLMKAASRGILKPKTASRQISRLGRAIHQAVSA